jgi:hypothetical protein
MRPWSVDSEWGYRDGCKGWVSKFEPVVFCAVNVDSGERISFWGRDARLKDWIAGHFADLFVSHSLVAEATFLMQCGIRPPRCWYDTYIAERFITNRWRFEERHYKANLSDSLRRLGLDHLVLADKKALQQKILNLDFTDGDRPEITDYCYDDCVAAIGLYLHKERQGKVPQALMAHWVAYSLAVAMVVLRGTRFDL